MKKQFSNSAAGSYETPVCEKYPLRTGGVLCDSVVGFSDVNAGGTMENNDLGGDF